MRALRGRKHPIHSRRKRKDQPKDTILCPESQQTERGLVSSSRWYSIQDQ